MYADWIESVQTGAEPVTAVPEELQAAAESTGSQPLGQGQRARFFMTNVLARTLRQPVQ
jgi:hypothetical protein